MEEHKPEVIGPTVITRSACPYSGGNSELSNPDFRSGLEEEEEYAIQFDGAYKHYGSGKSRWESWVVQYSNHLNTELNYSGIQMVDLCSVVKWSGIQMVVENQTK